MCSKEFRDNERSLRVATWNIAAVNNNPFEYFITHDDPAYNKLMRDFEAFVEEPGDLDVTVSDIVDDAMFLELKDLMVQEGFDKVEETAEYWKSNLKERKIVSGFLKDAAIGSKRLCSMPDRVTNTINSTAGTLFRPTVINCYEQSMPSVSAWWVQWKNYMFATEASIAKKGGDMEVKRVCRLLDPIRRSKYPAVSESEEAISLPLQIACMAAFDAILVHVVNILAPGKWHKVKTSMVDALHKNKFSRTLDIIASNVYATCDVIFLQEVAASLVVQIEGHALLGANYHVLSPNNLDGRRDQNSLVLAAKSRFEVATSGWSGEDTAKVTELLTASEHPAPIDAGDLFVVRCVEKSHEKLDDCSGEVSEGGRRYLLASFHGDTNGLATIPVINAMHKYISLLEINNEVMTHSSGEGGAGTDCVKSPILLFGLDANTYETHEQGKRQGVVEFAERLKTLGLTTCWGDVDPSIHTTYNARTFLQPQLNKAVRMSERAKSPLTDKNPKDHIVFRAGDLRAYAGGCVSGVVSRDNTGEGIFDADIPFPTLNFPSDHAIVCADLEIVG